jgi:putative addiction module component (TIGR02574 family)
MPSLPIAQFAQLGHTLGMRPADIDIAAMSIEQRWELIERLFASMPDTPAAFDDDAELVEELRRRIAEDEAHPEHAVDALQFIDELRRRPA